MTGRAPARVLVLVATLLALGASCTRERDFAYFESQVGNRVCLVGRVAAFPWQHMTKGVPGKTLVYVDLDAGKHQVVGHFDVPPRCAGEVAFEGKVFEVRGPSKAAIRHEPDAASDEFWEYAVDVASWRCL